MNDGGGVARGPEVEFDQLSEYLKALANPNRLELLWQLRFPRTVSEISLTPKRAETGGNPDRLISRQAVERHLQVLESIAVVRTLPATREGRPVDEYVVNHANVFAIIEELRKLTLIKPHAPMDPLATVNAENRIAAGPAQAKGPRLILVGGVYEGKTFPLTPGPAHEVGWVIGRREDCDVRLDYDPFVSHENTRIVHHAGRYFVEDNVQSRNGTLLNYEPMPRGGRLPLETGDLVGVGRSLLLFRGA